MQKNDGAKCNQGLRWRRLRREVEASGNGGGKVACRGREAGRYAEAGGSNRQPASSRTGSVGEGKGGIQAVAVTQPGGEMAIRRTETSGGLFFRRAAVRASPGRIVFQVGTGAGLPAPDHGAGDSRTDQEVAQDKEEEDWFLISQPSNHNLYQQGEIIQDNSFLSNSRHALRAGLFPFPPSRPMARGKSLHLSS